MKPKTKKIIIAILIVLILAASVFAYLYFFTDMFKTPEDLFYKYLGKMAKNESGYSYQDALEELNKVKDKSYTEKTSTKVEIETKGTSYKNKVDQITYDEISKMRIDFETKNVPSQKKSEGKMELKYQDENVTQLEYFQNSDKYGVKSEFLGDNYVVVENKNLKSLFRKLGIPSTNIPDQFENMDLYDLLYVSKEDQEKISKGYTEAIRKNIPQENYKKTENVTKNINGNDVNTTVYSLELNAKDLMNMLIGILEQMKNDDKMLELVSQKMEKFSTMSLSPEANDMMRYIDLGEMSKEQMSRQIEYLITGLKIGMTYVDTPLSSTVLPKIEIDICVANDDVVRMEFKTSDNVVFALDFYDAEDKEHIDVFVADDSYYGQLTRVLGIESKTTKNGDEIKIEGAICFLANKKEQKIGYEVTTNGKLGEDKNSAKYKFFVDTDEIVVKISIDSEMEYSDDINIEEKDSKNSLVLNNMSKEELEKYFEKVGNDAQDILLQKFVRFGIMDEKTANKIKETQSETESRQLEMLPDQQ